MNPTVLQSDVLAMAPEFLRLDQAQLATSLALYNPLCDNIVTDKVFPGTSPNGGTISPIYMAKLLIICHWIKLSFINTDGQISGDRVGAISTTYHVADPQKNQDWNGTIYGQRYIQFRRAYVVGAGFAPQPMPSDFLLTP